MTKKTNTPVTEATEDEGTGRTRAKRRKTYQPVRDTQLPVGLLQHFAKDGYDLKQVRWTLLGEEDYRYLNRRVNEGYEFVTKDEIPQEYLAAMRIENTRTAPNGLVTMGDLCLMKIDSELRQSRRDHYRNVTENEIASVDIHVLGRKGGFNTSGSRSKVSLREPSFEE